MKGICKGFSLYFSALHILSVVQIVGAFPNVPIHTTATTDTTTTTATTAIPISNSIQNILPLRPPQNQNHGRNPKTRCRRITKLNASPFAFSKKTLFKRSPPSGDILGSLCRKDEILHRKRTWRLPSNNNCLRSVSLDQQKNGDGTTTSLRKNKDLITAVDEVKGAAQNVTNSASLLKKTIVTNGANVSEVKGAAQNVTTSAGVLTKTIVTNGPNIISKLLSAVVSKEMREDIKTRRQHYKSDWLDAFKNKRQCVPAILFLYFACLAPVVSFGTISSQITEGAIGVVEFFLASGAAGMAYSILSGQPMAFIAPTGLTLAFISGLFRFCTLRNIAFFPIYTWVGLWTGFFTTMLGIRGSSKFIRYCTRFTDEIFNSLLSINFIYEAFSSLRRNFLLADPSNLSMPFVSLSIALGTYWSTLQIIALQTSIYFNQRIRKITKDFGPVAIIFAFAALNNRPWVKKFQVPTLEVPSTFQLAGGRNFLVPFMDAPVWTRLLCAFPALLLTALCFMDQNISVRVVNNPDNKLKKGSAYNLDMVALGLITTVLSIFGLPWMCGATVQSMNHVKALTTMKFDEETQSVEVDHVVETRTTGFIIHSFIAGTLLLLPALRYVPIPVVSGVFLFLGRKLMTGNTFLKRILDAFAEQKRLPPEHPINTLGRKKMNLFTSIQLLCLVLLWTFKQNSATAIFFPSVIGMLMFIRSFILPRFFSEKELIALGDPDPE